MAEWFEDEAFWQGLYPFIFSPERQAGADDEVAQVVELVGFTNGDILDLCCGPGRHAVALARRGWAVTGVDKSAFLLAEAKAHAAAAGVDIEWIASDMRDFVRPESFDLVLSLFTSFGYFDDPADDLRVLRQIHRSLRPGGRVVVDVLGKENLARTFQSATAGPVSDAGFLIARHEIYDDWSRIRNEWTVVRGDRAQTYRFHHSLYSGQELRALAAAAGFTSIRLHGSLAGGEYGPQAHRLVVVAEKEQEEPC